EGFFEADELGLIAEHHLWTVIASPWQVRVLKAFSSPCPIGVWLKLDSGMHRLGLDVKEFRDAWLSLRSLPQVGEMVLMTHLARADELDHPRTHEQGVVFADASRGMAAPLSMCNSSGLLGWSGMYNDWARPGLMLYGVNPFAQERSPLTESLRPVMMVYSRLIAVRDLPAGEPVGYGAHFVTERPTRMGVVAMGYADGYPQFAVNGTPVLVDGRICPLVGRVSMDMLTVDLTDHVEVDVGSQVQLWGVQPGAAELAARCGVSAYQLLCGLKRVRRSYVGEMGPV
ncbi:MAG TPA: alanine racemase, partial [Xylella sp.]